jgi:hypothetical protein
METVTGRAYSADMDDDERIARSDEDIRRVLALARRGIARYGYGEDLHPDDLAGPWRTSGPWQDNAWLRGVRDLLEWVLGERACGPVTGYRAAGDRPTMMELYGDTPNIDELMLQGARRRVEPGWIPPQSAEAMEATLDWLDGTTDEEPARVSGGLYQYNEDWVTGEAVPVSPAR